MQGSQTQRRTQQLIVLVQGSQTQRVRQQGTVSQTRSQRYRVQQISLVSQVGTQTRRQQVRSGVLQHTTWQQPGWYLLLLAALLFGAEALLAGRLSGRGGAGARRERAL